MSDLMAGLEFIRTYLGDLLSISNLTFEDHLHQLQVVLRRLRRAGLKVNAEKSSFFAPEIEYLGYMCLKCAFLKYVECIIMMIVRVFLAGIQIMINSVSW